MGVPSRAASTVTVPLAASARSAWARTSHVSPSITWMDAPGIRSRNCSISADPRGRSVPRAAPGRTLPGFCACNPAYAPPPGPAGAGRLAPPRTRQDGDQRAILRDAVPCEKLLFRERRPHQASRADDLCRLPESRAPKELLLEREDAKQPVDHAAHARNASFSPGPRPAEQRGKSPGTSSRFSRRARRR